MKDPTKTAVLLINTGSPEAPTTPALRRYLDQFLSDTRIVDLPRWRWWPVLHGIILRTRPKKSAELYQNIWTEAGSPLVANMEALAQELSTRLGVKVVAAMRYGAPSVETVMEALKKDGIEQVLAMPLFAQYCPHTSASCLDAVFKVGLRVRDMPSLRTVHDFHDHPAYIHAVKARIEAHWAEHGRAIDRGGRLVLSFHSTPVASREKGDVYYAQCLRSGELIAQSLGLGPKEWQVTFQSRFGHQPWIEPFTIDVATKAAEEGVSLDVVCPGFAVDCLETLEEIGLSMKEDFEKARKSDAVTFSYVPAINATPEAVSAYEEILLAELQGWV